MSRDAFTKIYNLHNFHLQISRENTLPKLQGRIFQIKENARFSKFRNKTSNFRKEIIIKKNSLGRFAHVNSRCRSVGPFRYRVVHSDALSIYFHSCTLFFGYFGIFCALEIDEREAS